MLRKKLLRLGHPVSLQALVEALVADATQRGGDYRPHVDNLTPVIAEGSELPAWIDIGSGESGLIFGEPCPDLLNDLPLLWIQLRPIPRRGRFAGGLYSGHVVVHLWQGPEYPLFKREVNWLVADHCGAYHDYWRRLPRGWETMSLDSSGRSPADADKIAPPYIVLGKTPAPTPDAKPAGPESEQEPSAAPEIPAHRKARPGLGTGKPRTPWNEALMVKMSAVPTEELYNFDPFFEGWLADYMLGAGRPPRYPEDTFKQAATSCAERIIRQRAARNS